MFTRELSLEEKSVQGTLVTGLNDMDIHRLDDFEGNVSAFDVNLAVG